MIEGSVSYNQDLHIHCTPQVVERGDGVKDGAKDPDVSTGT